MDTGRPIWRSRAWIVAAGVLLLLALILTTVGIQQPFVAWAVALTAIGIAAVVVGWTLVRTRAQRRLYEDELAAWVADRATQTERLRIASDLHDLVSHGLGLITVRAAVARRMIGSDGDAERVDALTDIERVSRETTTELRRMLALLRTSGPALLRPADTLDDLPAIVAEANAAGLTATLGVENLGEVSLGAQLTVCAVAREALHNILRHAGPTQAHVGVRRARDTIVVEVQDAGPHEPWQALPGAGHGLDALRERVTALGGSLDADPNAHGFRLTACIPDRSHP